MLQGCGGLVGGWADCRSSPVTGEKGGWGLRFPGSEGLKCHQLGMVIKVLEACRIMIGLVTEPGVEVPLRARKRLSGA